MPDVALTVLFSTRNGEQVLPRTLEAYCRVLQPPHRWKLVVVDNGSRDSTSAILASFRSRLPLEILQQPIAGQNRARNCGLQAIEGQLVVLTDDDAIPDSSFLTAWSKYLDRCLEYDLFGGSIEPVFDTPPPKWMLKSKSQLGMLFAVRELPEGPTSPNDIYGPNMAVRSSIFVAGHRFDENFGPDGTDPHYPMGAETELFRRLVRGGAKAWFAQEPRVHHIVRTNQITWPNLANRSYRHGRGIARLMQEGGDPAPTSIRRSALVDRLSRLRYWLRMFSPFPLQRFNGVCDYHWMRGFRDEWARTATSRRTPSA
jgi:glycosyltransferase involved in cell wall biosynthesis